MELLITGTDGFMGQVLKDYFQSRGDSVFGTVYMREALENEIHFDIRKDQEFKKLPRGFRGDMPSLISTLFLFKHVWITNSVKRWLNYGKENHVEAKFQQNVNAM